jgi:ribosomal protein L44E
VSHHHTQADTEVTKWCNRCKRHTQHAVINGREAHCLEHANQWMTQDQIEREKQRKFEQRQPRLFD